MISIPITFQSLGFSHGFPMVSPKAPLGRGLSSSRATADPHIGAAAGATARPVVDFSCIFFNGFSIFDWFMFMNIDILHLIIHRLIFHEPNHPAMGVFGWGGHVLYGLFDRFLSFFFHSFHGRWEAGLRSESQFGLWKTGMSWIKTKVAERNWEDNQSQQFSRGFFDSRGPLHGLPQPVPSSYDLVLLEAQDHQNLGKL